MQTILRARTPYDRLRMKAISKLHAILVVPHNLNKGTSCLAASITISTEHMYRKCILSLVHLFGFPQAK